MAKAKARPGPTPEPAASWPTPLQGEMKARPEPTPALPAHPLQGENRPRASRLAHPSRGLSEGLPNGVHP